MAKKSSFNLNSKHMITKFDDEISLKFGVGPENRSFKDLLDKGCIVVDKDCGPTSHKTVENIKHVLKIDKAGHSGTLDPQVSGVLVVGLGRATRLMEYMLKSNKEYVCVMFVHKPVTNQELEDVFEQFRGEIEQVPPIVSAVKRQARKRMIYELEIVEREQDNQYILFRVKCQHGTYIRKLCTDIGLQLGVNAQMVELRRTKAGPKTENDSMISVDKLQSLMDLYQNSKEEQECQIFEQELRKYILPMEHLLDDFKYVIVRDSAVNSVSNGSDLGVPGILQVDERIELGEEIALMTGRGELIAMGVAFMSGKDMVKKNKGAAIKTHKVFMDKGYYPKSWF